MDSNAGLRMPCHPYPLFDAQALHDLRDQARRARWQSLREQSRRLLMRLHRALAAAGTTVGRSLQPTGAGRL